MARAETNWETQMRKGLLEFFILLVIASEPMHGYRIAMRLRELCDFEVGDGTLYPLLARLTKRGAIMPVWATEGSGAARKTYSITDFGQSELNDMQRLWKKFDKSRTILGG